MFHAIDIEMKFFFWSVRYLAETVLVKAET